MFSEAYSLAQLLEAGLDPNLSSDDGMTLLYEAIFYRRTDVAKLLLDWGADPNMPINGVKHWTPAHQARFRSNDDLLELLETHGADLTIKDNNGWSPDRPHREFYEAVGQPPHGCHFVPRAEMA